MGFLELGAVATYHHRIILILMICRRIQEFGYWNINNFDFDLFGMGGRTLLSEKRESGNISVVTELWNKP